MRTSSGDGSVKSPSAALRFNFVAAVPEGRGPSGTALLSFVRLASGAFYGTIEGKRFNEKKGYTFLELMLVILLLGFMFLFAWPNFRGLSSPGKSRQAVLELAGALRFAHSQAAATKCRHRVNFEIRENTFWITRERDKKEFLAVSSSYGQRTHLPPGLIFLDIQQPHRGKMREGTGYIEFSPTGWAEDSAIHLRRGEEDILTIFVRPLGGKIEISSGYVEKATG